MNSKQIISGIIIALFIIALLIFTVKHFGEIKREDSLSELVTLANNFEERDNIKEAKSVYQKLIKRFPESNQAPLWREKLGELNIKLLFSPVITEGSQLYEIQSGDSLIKIAKKFNTTVELIKRSNNLKNDKIFAGKKLKVYTLPFSIVVNKTQNILILKSDQEIVKTYNVSTGKDNCTPVGNFKIINKLVNPTWYKDGSAIPSSSPENILGTRWLGFDIAGGYGIHGTNDPKTIGQYITQGCVRMSNQEVEELYAIVPVGTEANVLE